jgi:hypothetical protein
MSGPRARLSIVRRITASVTSNICMASRSPVQ